LLATLGLALAGCGGHVSEGGDCPAAQRAHTLSGFCVPRWVSLKHGEVMGRKGPGKDYPALWVYRVDGLPVQVVAETEEWRRICDPEGGAAWVHRSEIDGRRTLISRADTQTPIRLSANPASRTLAFLNPKALARLTRCRGGWCQVKVGAVAGWIAADQVWGLGDARQCR
jgi:SH3-like domain-containing protein